MTWYEAVGLFVVLTAPIWGAALIVAVAEWRHEREIRRGLWKG